MTRQRYVKGIDEVPRRLHELERQFKEFMPSVANTVKDQVSKQLSIVETLGEVVNTVEDQVSKQAAITETLQEVSQNYYTEFTTEQTGFTGWRTQGSVTLTSSTGRIEITYGGTLNSGEGYFCYSVKQGSTNIVTRESVQANPARRVAVSGGASFAPSGFGHTVIDVPVGKPLTVALELYTAQSYTYFFGGSLLAKVAL